MAFGDANIVGDVTETLRDLLTWPTHDKTVSSLLAQGDINFDSPATLATSGDPNFKALNVFLYRVLENPFAKNQSWTSVSAAAQEYPPLAVNLHYMLTPYAKETVSAHHVLTYAMQVLHDNAIVSGPELHGALATAVEQIAIALLPMTLEELTQVWNALQSPYRLSVCYEVRIALLRSEIRRDIHRVETKIDAFAQL